MIYRKKLPLESLNIVSLRNCYEIRWSTARNYHQILLKIVWENFQNPKKQKYKVCTVNCSCRWTVTKWIWWGKTHHLLYIVTIYCEKLPSDSFKNSMRNFSKSKKEKKNKECTIDVHCSCRWTVPKWMWWGQTPSSFIYSIYIYMCMPQW
jgi:hypothetical protein